MHLTDTSFVSCPDAACGQQQDMRRQQICAINPRHHRKPGRQAGPGNLSIHGVSGLRVLFAQHRGVILRRSPGRLWPEPRRDIVSARMRRRWPSLLHSRYLSTFTQPHRLAWHSATLVDALVRLHPRLFEFEPGSPGRPPQSRILDDRPTCLPALERGLHVVRKHTALHQ